MDPHYISTVQTSRLTDDMFLGLLTYGQNGAAIAGAAESWTISEDGKTYTFKLRDHVWSDGTPVTAEDFVYAWRRILAPETGAERSEEHTSELQSLMRISYAVFCLKKKNNLTQLDPKLQQSTSNKRKELPNINNNKPK